MEPIATPKPEEEYDKLVGSELDHGGNPQLMEAQFLQLVSSIRALASSNQQLREALLEEDDVDFHSAIKENKYLILKKRSLLVNLVTDMKRMSVNIDVPDDIRDMVEERETQYYGSPTVPAHEDQAAPSTTNDTTTTTQEDAGVYL
mmetsp:Transcript_8207/g.10718  ORF Transcript_8207/g.10718 Transcript_8207/m.10718 type:complete len:146 (+) Transcript_8207:102-539(+)